MLIDYRIGRGPNAARMTHSNFARSAVFLEGEPPRFPPAQVGTGGGYTSNEGTHFWVPQHEMNGKGDKGTLTMNALYIYVYHIYTPAARCTLGLDLPGHVLRRVAEYCLDCLDRCFSEPRVVTDALHVP